jgi:anti-anti-sigma regulatory factor
MLNETYKLNNDFFITLQGSFDADSVNVMKSEIEAYSKLNTNIIFDLEHVPYINSIN